MYQWIKRTVIFIVFFLQFLISAYAVGPGFYLGLMTGPASNTAGNQIAQNQTCTGSVTAKPRNSNMWGTRLFMGYQFTHWAGVELGLFNYFTTIHYSVPPGFSACSGLSTRVRTIDIVGKFSAPFQDYFDVYAKAGLAIAYVTSSGAFSSCKSGSCTTPPCKRKNCSSGCITPCIGNRCTMCGSTQNNVGYRPTFSLGASINLSQRWLADVSLNRTLTGGPAGNIDFLAIGISYHIVDVYCGQFLC